jgi:hypothetical protein
MFQHSSLDLLYFPIILRFGGGLVGHIVTFSGRHLDSAVDIVVAVTVQTRLQSYVVFKHVQQKLLVAKTPLLTATAIS